MEAFKLETTIAGHEFRGEGPQEVVQAQFQAWLDVVKAITAAAPAAVAVAPTPAVEPSNGNGAGTRAPVVAGMDDEQLRTAFSEDVRNGRKLVTLRFAPQGENRAQTAMILLLFGFKQLAAIDEVPVMMLKDALEQSGFRIDRVDRIAYLPVRQGLVLKGGKKGPGGSYRLTNQGFTRAAADLRQMLEQM